MIKLYRTLTIVLMLTLPTLALSAHWRGYHDGVKAQVWATAASPNTDGDALDAMLHEIAANHWQGYADDVNIWNTKAIDAAFKLRKLSAHCLTISNYGVWRLREAGYQARNVGLMNMHPEVWNNIGDAHAVLEVWHPRYAQWVVVDFLFNRMYAQTAVSFAQGRGEPIMLADDPYSNPADFTEQLPDPEAEIYPRVAQLVLIESGEGGAMWYGDSSAQPVVAEFSRRHGGGENGGYRPDFLAWAYGA